MCKRRCIFGPVVPRGNIAIVQSLNCVVDRCSHDLEFAVPEKQEAVSLLRNQAQVVLNFGPGRTG